MRFYSEDSLPGRRLKSEARLANYQEMKNPNRMVNEVKHQVLKSIADKLVESDYCKVIYMHGYVDVVLDVLVMTPEEYKEAVTKAFVAGRNSGSLERISNLDFAI